MAIVVINETTFYRRLQKLYNLIGDNSPSINGVDVIAIISGQHQGDSKDNIQPKTTTIL